MMTVVLYETVWEQVWLLYRQVKAKGMKRSPENEEKVNNNAQPGAACERVWRPSKDTVPELVQGRQQKLLDWKAGLAEKTNVLFSHKQGHISISSVSPQQFWTVSLQRVALLCSSAEHFGVPLQGHFRQGKGSAISRLTWSLVSP